MVRKILILSKAKDLCTLPAAQRSGCFTKQPQIRRYNQAMNFSLPVFREPTAVEKIFNRTFGFIVGLGLGPRIIRARSSRTKIRQALLDSGGSAGTGWQALSGGASRTNPVGAQRRGRGRSHAEKRKRAQEIPAACDFRRRQATHPESLSRQLQARSATILPGASGIARACICRD